VVIELPQASLALVLVENVDLDDYILNQTATCTLMTLVAVAMALARLEFELRKQGHGSLSCHFLRGSGRLLRPVLHG
jgi:hypothetical protein